MVYARNQVVISVSGGGSYLPANTYTLPEGEEAEKLSVRVYDNDVIMEVSETNPPTFTGDIDSEFLAPKGFSSFVFVTAITGFRVKANSGNARIDFIAYG